LNHTALHDSRRWFKRRASDTSGRLLHRTQRLVAASLLIGIATTLASCANGSAPASSSVSSVNAPEEKSVYGSDYRLGSGDKIKLMVYGEDDISGDFEISGTGGLSLPLVGQIQAGGLTVAEFELSLTQALKTYVRSPRVSVQILNYRPFYIQGEVKNGGEYPYSNGLLVRDAVAKAGGYTYRAASDHLYIRHANEHAEQRYSLDGTVHVQPGDNIRVPERFF
jgi:protein involved in polysaccharide export with SLBB domain